MYMNPFEALLVVPLVICILARNQQLTAPTSYFEGFLPTGRRGGQNNHLNILGQCPSI